MATILRPSLTTNPSADTHLFGLSKESSAMTTTQKTSLWHSPVLYLFGVLAAMLGLIIFPLLMLLYSHWRRFSDHENQQSDDDDLENREGPCDLTRIGAKIPTCSKLFCISESERKFPDLLLGFSPATSSNPLQSAHSMSSGSKVDPLEVILQSAKIKRSTASPDEASAFKRSAPAASFQTPPTQSSSDRPEPLEVDPLSRYPPTPPASPRASASGGTIAHVPEGFGNVYKVSYWPEIDRLLFPPLKEVFSEFSPEDMAENDVHNAFMVIQLAKGNLGRNKAHEEVSKEERGGKGGGRPRADQPAAGQPAGCHIGHV
ncbi:uncharacterized protein LOC141596422 isoform X2 [Silene latifolia]|uniref:uncharacterized protein LOC141596422 isoform X2 n=1 Tax=Silene latifolia TaxID=37657 RepID=UPI003D771956